MSTSDSPDRLCPILDEYSHSTWLISMTYFDPFDEIFPTDEGIMEVMSLEETPWDDSHHRSSFFLRPEIEIILRYLQILTFMYFIKIFYQGNLGVIYATVPIDISVKPRIMENVHIDASCSPDEIETYKELFKEFCDVFSWSYE
jgi:hypothetical protein